MKINIVNYEVSNPWILSKIALKLKENLLLLGHDVTLSNKVNIDADINHHIVFHSYKGIDTGLHTTMITHVDNIVKLKKIKEDLKTAKVGICMSKPTMDELIRLGIPKEQLQYAHCAHDGNAKSRKITLGFTTRLYADGRKREDFFLESLKSMSPDDFRFEIMGFGWAPHINRLTKMGFEVNYFEEFDYNEYKKLFTRLDYYIYLGDDEGSMGFIDALAAGVKTIVQPQGFHLDAQDGLVHPFTNLKEYKKIMSYIAEEKRRLQASVVEWTWLNYAKKHVEIWDLCMKGDYIKSESNNTSLFTIVKIKTKLVYNYFKQKITLVLNLRRRKTFPAGPRFFGPNESKDSINN